MFDRFDRFNFDGMDLCFVAVDPAPAFDYGICRVDRQGGPDEYKCDYPGHQYRFVVDKDAKDETKSGRDILDEAYRR